MKKTMICQSTAQQKKKKGGGNRLGYVPLPLPLPLPGLLQIATQEWNQSPLNHRCTI